jgi:N-acetylglucosamine-6-sulfatase
MNNDVAPTLADLADARAPNTVDGRSIVPLFEGTEPPNWRTGALVEGWDKGGTGAVPTYKALRTKDRMYIECETGEKELYDLKADPYQLENAYAGADAATKKSLAARLDSLRGCEGKGCRRAEDGD